MSKALNLQDSFLNISRKERTALTIFLTNGFQFKGYVKSFDSFTVLLECEGKQSLVYKHAISTIIPCKPVKLEQEENEPEVAYA